MAEEEKTYSQMRKEFCNNFACSILPELKRYEKIRTQKQIKAIIPFILFFIVIAFYFLFRFFTTGKTFGYYLHPDYIWIEIFLVIIFSLPVFGFYLFPRYFSIKKNLKV